MPEIKEAKQVDRVQEIHNEFIKDTAEDQHLDDVMVNDAPNQQKNITVGDWTDNSVSHIFVDGTPETSNVSIPFSPQIEIMDDLWPLCEFYNLKKTVMQLR